MQSPLLSSLMGPNTVLSAALPVTYLTQVAQHASTLFLIITLKYLLFLSHMDYVPYKVFLCKRV